MVTAATTGPRRSKAKRIVRMLYRGTLDGNFLTLQRGAHRRVTVDGETVSLTYDSKARIVANIGDALIVVGKDETAIAVLEIVVIELRDWDEKIGFRVRSGETQDGQVFVMNAKGLNR